MLYFDISYNFVRKWNLIIQFIISQIILSNLSQASEGDHSNEFTGCFHTCDFNNCSTEKALNEFHFHQDTVNKLLFWSCEDECKYECMWQTTEAYLDRGWKVPQFYGKWPFIRFLGLQEPASVLFSALNFLSHCFNVRKFRNKVPSNAPLYLLWHFYVLVCLNAWFWSIIFHARDTPLTEKLDYFSAFSMVLSSLLMLLIRTSGRKNNKRKIFLICGCASFFTHHIWYLTSRRFDYGYNMKVNVFVGLVNGFGWLWWSWRRPNNRQYCFWCNVTIAYLGATLFLELLDFPPLFWIFDAHAFWHLSTVALPFFWYRFIIEDSYYLLQDASSHSSLKKSA